MSSLVSVAEIRDYLQITSNSGYTTDANLAMLANYASMVAESFCGRTFAADNTTEYHNGGRSSIFVDRIPINYITLLSEYNGNEYVSLVGTNNTTSELPNVLANANSAVGYIWDKDTGQISRDTGEGGGNRALGITDPASFNNYKNGIKITYNGGYETIPYDLKLAVLDYIKILYKQEQGSSTFSLQGESKEVHPLSSGFPAHVRRILELYRLV